MARVAALIPDLLFGSKVQAALTQAGHEVELVVSEIDAWASLQGDPTSAPARAKIDVLIVDLTSEDFDGVALVDSLAAGGELHGVRTLGFFAHVEPQVRERALTAGFDLVVPRSRMARVGAELVRQLTSA